MTRERNKAVAYARLSFAEQGDPEQSASAQLTAIRCYGADNGYTIEAEYVEREATMDNSRPEFDRMLAGVLTAHSDVGTIIVTHQSRFMRRSTKAELRKEMLRRRGIRVVAIQQHVSDDPDGSFAKRVFELIDQLESEKDGLRS